MKETTFHLRDHLLFALLTVLTLILCIGVGSVSVPFRDTAEIIFRAIAGWEQPSGSAVAIILYTRLPRVLCVALVGAMLALGGCALLGKEVPAGISKNIILNVRLPRVLNVALVGAALSLCGAAMQGLLRNPLADGSTLGVSSGASLGAALAILSGVSIPFLPFGGTAGAAMLSAFLSLVVLLALAFALDHSLATNTLILLGVVFSMFVSALLSLLITFSGDKLRAITFWTMGNLSSASYQNALTLLATLLLCGGIILTQARALNAMSMGEEYALHVGVSVRRVKLTVMICVSAMIGMSVSVGGGIGFVGLVTPHMIRLIVGANHRRTLPACLYGGAIFLLLADLISRTILAPAVLPVGVVTSIIGAAAFLVIFLRTKRRERA